MNRIEELVYELLDAHDDTAQLAGEHPPDERWRAHLAYLRDLQRIAREELAYASREAAQAPGRELARPPLSLSTTELRTR